MNKRMTKNLPFVRRIVARLVHKLQKIMIKKPATMRIYYALAKVHFKLHYGFELTNTAQLEGVHLARAYAIKRHLRLVIQSGLISKDQVKVFRPQLEQAFLDGVNGDL